MDKRWRQYQGALLWNGNPTKEIPTEKEALEALNESGAMFARWTSDWDCKTPTEWWYCIKDTFTPLSEFSAKQRYRINKGLKNCNVVRLSHDAIENYTEDIYQVAEQAFADYPAAYRPILRIEDYKRWLSDIPKQQDIWLCCEKETGKVIGYAVCYKQDGFINLEQVKVPTKKLNTEANAAIVFRLSEYYLKEQHLNYICDGERNIKHRTQYQDYLVRVLNFRYAYCKLNIVYSSKMHFIVNLLYHFTVVVKLLGKSNSFFYNVYCVLQMERIRRSFR